MDSNASLSEQYAQIGAEWADAESAASILEDCKSAYLSERMMSHINGGMPVNRAEATVKASSEWKDYVDRMVKARKNANLLKVKMETIRMRFQEWSSEQANERAMARL